MNEAIANLASKIPLLKYHCSNLWNNKIINNDGDGISGLFFWQACMSMRPLFFPDFSHKVIE